MRDVGLVYVAQVHSHPPGVVGHSYGDDLWAFMKHEGLVSIVIQNYGKTKAWPLVSVQVFHEGEFLRLTAQQIKEQFALIPASIDLR